MTGVIQTPLCLTLAETLVQVPKDTWIANAKSIKPQRANDRDRVSKSLQIQRADDRDRVPGPSNRLFGDGPVPRCLYRGTVFEVNNYNGTAEEEELFLKGNLGRVNLKDINPYTFIIYFQLFEMFWKFKISLVD